jgi:hypothetical protein
MDEDPIQDQHRLRRGSVGCQYSDRGGDLLVRMAK